MQFSPASCHFHFLGFEHSIQYPDILSLRSFHNMLPEFRTRKKTSKIMLIFAVREIRRKTDDSEPNGRKNTRNLSSRNVFVPVILSLSLTKYLNFDTFSTNVLGVFRQTLQTLISVPVRN
jgi:hypothetical protein